MLVIGHRGASRAEAENTPEAFRRAELMGADAVELDVRRAPDGALVVYHDSLPAASEDLARLPRFAEILDTCGELLVNVEIKNLEGESGFDPTMAVVDDVVAELDSRGDPGRYVISSFSSAAVDRSREVAPRIATALLVFDAPAGCIAEIAAAGHSAVHPHVDLVDEEVVQESHRNGLAVNTWTCNDLRRIRELAAMGVDGVCTDVPDEALAALGRTGPLSPRRWGKPT